MTGVARIRFAGGGILLPARTAYDRETALAALRHALHRSAAVQFDCDGRHWRLTCRDRGDCARCLRTAARYGVDDVRVDGPTCFACLAALLSLTRAAEPRPASFPDDEPLRHAATAGVTAHAQHARDRRARRKETW